MSDTLFFFDLDGTLTSEELLPIIAREVGLEAEMSELTKKTMAGEVPFDQSFRHRVQMLRNIPESTISEIVCNVPVHEELMEWIRHHKDNCFVLTGNLDCWVGPWLKMHDLRGYTSKGGKDKNGVVVQSIIRKQHVIERAAPNKTVMIGDGANDAQAIAAASVGIANAIVHPVAPVVLEVADYLFFEETKLCKTLSLLS